MTIFSGDPMEGTRESIKGTFYAMFSFFLSSSHSPCFPPCLHACAHDEPKVPSRMRVGTVSAAAQPQPTAPPFCPPPPGPCLRFIRADLPRRRDRFLCCVDVHSRRSAGGCVPLRAVVSHISRWAIGGRVRCPTRGGRVATLQAFVYVGACCVCVCMHCIAAHTLLNGGLEKRR